MIIFLYGKDTFRSRERLHTLRDSFQKKYDAHSLSIYHEKNPDDLKPEKFHQMIWSSGLFHTKKLCVIEELISSKNEKVKKELQEKLSDIEKIQDTILILWEQESASLTKNKLYVQLKKLKLSEKFDLLSRGQLIDWTRKRFQQFSTRCLPDAEQELLDMTGDELWKLSSEIDKLVALSNQGTVTREMVKKMGSPRFDESIFVLTDALSAKNSEKAMYILEKQWKSEVHPLQVLASIIWQFRNIMSIKAAAEQHSQPQSIGKILGIHPFVISKTLPASQRFSWGKLREVFSLLEHADQSMKSGKNDPRAQMSVLVAKMCSNEKKPVSGPLLS